MRKVTPVPLPDKAPEIKKREPSLEPPQRKLARILVVEDDSSVRNLMCSLLEDYQVGTAEDGAKGLELFKSGRFDLVVTDLKMPKLGGMELLAEIKVMNPDAKVIVMSGAMDENTKRILLEMGAEVVLEKPLGIMEISDQVAKLLPN